MQVLTFFLEQDPFAVDISLVDTIEDKMPITPVPKSKPYVMGLITSRGHIIPVINTSLLLSSDYSQSQFEKLIIINLENEKIALAVSDIDDVLDIEEESIEKINKSGDLSIINVDSTIMTLLTYDQLKKI